MKAKGTQSQLDRPREKDTECKSGVGCSEREDVTSQSGSNSLLHKYDHRLDVATELLPYKDVLPPSLLPLTMRSQFPSSSSTVHWGNEY